METNTLTAADLLNPARDDNGPERAEFVADTLTLTVTRPDGSVVLETAMEPRGFKANETGKGDKKKIQGGVGWYSTVTGDEAGSYGRFAVTAGLRLSLKGVKVAPGTVVDISGEE